MKTTKLKLSTVAFAAALLFAGQSSMASDSKMCKVWCSTEINFDGTSFTTRYECSSNEQYSEMANYYYSTEDMSDQAALEIAYKDFCPSK